MLDAKTLISKAVRRRGMSFNSEFPELVGQYSSAIYRTLGAENIRLGLLEYYAHKLGYRLRLTIEEPDGTVVETVLSDPKNPIYTEDYFKRKEEQKAKNYSVRSEAVDKLHAERKKNAQLSRSKRAHKTGGIAGEVE